MANPNDADPWIAGAIAAALIVAIVLGVWGFGYGGR